MGTDRNRRQAAKTAQRRAAVDGKRKAELFASSLAGRVAAAARFPIARCVRQEKMFETGIGTVVLARQAPSGLIAVARFIVDVWCLGVKDVAFEDLTRSEFEAQMSEGERTDRYISIEPACARKLLAGAVAFAATSTFRPPKTYAVVQKLFGDVGATDCGETFVFGHEGRPTYAEGPNESYSFGRKIIATLERVHGPEGCDAIMPTSLSSNLAHLRAIVDAHRDTPPLKALRAEIEAYDNDRRTIDHNPDQEPVPPDGAEPGNDVSDQS